MPFCSKASNSYGGAGMSRAGQQDPYETAPASTVTTTINLHHIMLKQENQSDGTVVIAIFRQRFDKAVVSWSMSSSHTADSCNVKSVRERPTSTDCHQGNPEIGFV